jgi:hypothetical protein
MIVWEHTHCKISRDLANFLPKTRQKKRGKKPRAGLALPTETTVVRHGKCILNGATPLPQIVVCATMVVLTFKVLQFESKNEKIRVEIEFFRSFRLRALNLHFCEHKMLFFCQSDSSVYRKFKKIHLQ